MLSDKPGHLSTAAQKRPHNGPHTTRHSTMSASGAWAEDVQFGEVSEVGEVGEVDGEISQTEQRQRTEPPHGVTGTWDGAWQHRKTSAWPGLTGDMLTWRGADKTAIYDRLITFATGIYSLTRLSEFAIYQPR